MGPRHEPHALPFPDRSALEGVDFSDARGLRVGVATSSEANYAAFSLRHAGLEGRFDVIVGTANPYSVNRWRWTRPLLSQTSNRYDVPCVSQKVGVFGTVALNV